MSSLIAHIVDPYQNNLTIAECIRFRLPTRGICGHLWVPTLEDAPDDMPMCSRCDALRDRRAGTISGPHFVYRCYDATGRLIYVGCTRTPVQRLDQHAKSSWWHSEVASTRVVVFPTKDYALLKEHQAISQENPRWNVRGRDRSLWTAGDYADALYGMSKSGASDKRVEKMRAEAIRRYQFDPLNQDAQAS